MRYWWNQTYRHEVAGGYLWSPKRNANGARNPYYDFMRVVSPGDLVFSYADTLIKAIGLIKTHAYEAPKPLEFGNTGAYWEKIGWRVDVGFREMTHQVRPADYAEQIAKVLPGKYSPLRPNGFGLQNVYLTRVPADLAETLLSLIGVEARNIARAARIADEATATDAVGLIQWEAHQIEQLKQDHHIAPTEREALVLARRGQGKFRQKVAAIEKWCRITHVEKPEHLRASHCKPWRDSSNEERLDGENGLLLTPTIDHLFDRGFISFESNGDLLVSRLSTANHSSGWGSTWRAASTLETSVPVSGSSLISTGTACSSIARPHSTKQLNTDCALSFDQVRTLPATLPTKTPPPRQASPTPAWPPAMPGRRGM